MAELEDAVLPILRNIQADVADLKRESKETRADIRQLSERLDSFEAYFTYEMGLTSRNQSDIKRLQIRMTAVEERIDELEPTP